MENMSLHWRALSLSDQTVVLSSRAELLSQEAKEQTTLTDWSLDMRVKHVLRLGILGPLGLNVTDVLLSCGSSVWPKHQPLCSLDILQC